MSTSRPKLPFAVIGAGFLGFAVLVSGVWHPKMPAGGLTQVGRTTSISFEDGSVMELGETDTDQMILKRRRRAGWHGREYRQTFVMADGEEIEVSNHWLGQGDGSTDLASGDRLILAAYNREAKPEDSMQDNVGSVEIASLQIEGKDPGVADEADAKDRVVTDLIDGKDRVLATRDAKDAKDAPVFALTATKYSLDSGLDDPLSLIDGGIFSNLRTASSTGIISGGTGGPSQGGGSGSISTPPIGGAVPEPSALALVGVAGVAGLAFAVSRRRRQAAN